MLKAKDFRQRAWSALSGKWGTLVIITLIWTLIDAACGGLSAIGIGAVALFLIYGPLDLGLSQCYLKVARGGTPQIGEMFDGFRNFLRAFLLYLINSVFIMLWSLLFIIPGIIKSYSYSMGVYILADNPDMDANEARKQSMKMMDGNKWRLFCLELSFIGWILLSLLTFGILLFWVLPYMGVARAEFYEELKRQQGYTTGEWSDGTDNNNAEQPAGEQPESKTEDPFGELGGNTDSSSNGDKPLNADEL